MEKQDLRVIKTLRQIDAALLDCLRQMPFQKITIELLCRSALINRSTFYKYYVDKYDLLDQYLERTLSTFREHVHTDFINAPHSRIQDSSYMLSYQSTLEFIFSRKEEYQILWQAEIDRRIFHEMTEILRASILAALNQTIAADQNKQRYADLYAQLFASNMMLLIQWWFQNPHTVSQEEVEELMSSNMKYGMFKTFKKQMDQ